MRSKPRNVILNESLSIRRLFPWRDSLSFLISSSPHRDFIVIQFSRLSLGLLAFVTLHCWGTFGWSAEKWPLAEDPPANAVDWSVRTQSEIKVSQPLLATGLESVRPTTGGSFLLVGHTTGSTTREVWNLHSGSLLGSLTGRIEMGSSNCALSHDGELFIVTRKKNFTMLGAEVWSITENKRLKMLEMGPTAEPILWCGFIAPRQLLTWHEKMGGATEFRLLDVLSEEKPILFPGPQNADRQSVSVSPGGRFFAVAGLNGTLQICDLKLRLPPFQLTIPASLGHCKGARFTPDGSEVGAILNANGKAISSQPLVNLIAWSLKDGQQTAELKNLKWSDTETLTGPAAELPPIFEWLGDGSAFLLGKNTLVDRASGRIVWKLRPPSFSSQQFTPTLLGTDHLLIAYQEGSQIILNAVKLPWKQIDSALQSLENKSASWLSPGDKISLVFDFGKLRFHTPDQLTNSLTNILSPRLATDQFVLADNQPVSLKVSYSESEGGLLQKQERSGFPFPFPPSPPGFPPLRRRRGMADDNERLGTGTAFIIHADGYLLTCAHVVGSAPSVQVKIGDKTYHGRVISKNVPGDYALLKVELKGLPALPLADSSKLEQGEEVRAVGFPISNLLGESIKMTRGTIAGKVKHGGQNLFQVDASINPGNSGGPLFNEKGEVVGINSAKLVGAEIDNVGFSIPINDVKQMLQEQKVVLPAITTSQKLSGPDLIKKVSPSVALVTSTGGIDVGPEAMTVSATRIECTLALVVTGHSEPVWRETLIVDPNHLRVQGSLTAEKVRDMAFELLENRIQELSLPYFISKDPTPIVLPVVTDLSTPAQLPIDNRLPRKTRRGFLP